MQSRRAASGCASTTSKGWLHVLEGYEERHIIMDKDLG